jgi:putative spermidine/putrescine transport system substrate-binding protein
MKWRNIAWIVGALVVVAAGALWWLSRTAPVLTVATWAGAYGRAQASAMFSPYSSQAWVDVRIAQYDGGLDQLRGQVGAHAYEWDAVDLELPDAIAACKEGLLEPIDATGFPQGDKGIAAENDFVPGALGECWVGSVVYSQIIGFDPTRVKGKPKVIADFFDLRRYPGPRGLRRTSAKLNLELALLGSGVKPIDIYPTLATHDGLMRALAKLDTIRPFIVWWSRSGDPLKMLADQKVVFTTMPNSALFDAAKAKQKLGAIWDRQLYEMDVFGIPRGNPKKPMAMEFLHFATSTGALAHVAEWVPYGPARKSSIGLVDKNPELDIPMRAFLPTTPGHFKQAFRVDDGWWARHGKEIAPLWRVWVEGASASDLP